MKQLTLDELLDLAHIAIRSAYRCPQLTAETEAAVDKLCELVRAIRQHAARAGN